MKVAEERGKEVWMAAVMGKIGCFMNLMSYD